jgi:hypothetical protein
MIHPPSATRDQQIEQQTRVARWLMAALYIHNGAAPDKSVLMELAEAMKTLRELISPRRRADRGRERPGGGEKTMGLLLGPERTGHQVVATSRLQPIPTDDYRLIDPQRDSLTIFVVEDEIGFISGGVSAATLE